MLMLLHPPRTFPRHWISGRYAPLEEEEEEEEEEEGSIRLG